MPREARVAKLYGGKIEIRFFPDSHIFMVNGERVRAVTSRFEIIDKSRALIPWAVDMMAEHLEHHIGVPLSEEMILEASIQHELRKKAAADIGTETHEWIDAFIKGDQPTMPEKKEVLQAVNGFLEFSEAHKVNFEESEKIVYSKKHGYAGLMDAVATMKGKKGFFLLDHKASNGLYPGVAYQTSAYRFADEEETKREYAGRWALRYAKESEEEYMVRQERKLRKWMLKNPGKGAYEIKPYMPFEARFLDENPENFKRDFKAWLLADELTSIHQQVDKEFFSG